MQYIVTGATGHLGNTLLKKLTQAGHKVRALVLEGENTAMLSALPNLELVYGNVLNYESLVPLFQNLVTNEEICLIHTAGIISISERKPKLMQRVNIEGTQNMLRLATAFNVEHFIYVSSVHAIPESEKDVMIREIYEFDPDLNVGAYAKTKAAATQLVIDAISEGLSATIIHPSGIIGPYDFGQGHMTRLFENYFNGKLNARVNGEYDFVDVRDVADAIYVASLKKAQGPFIINGHKIKLSELFENMREIAGFKTKPLVFARWFVKIFLPLLEKSAAIRKITPLFTRYSLYTLTTHCNFSHNRANGILDYNPRPIKDTIRDTALWLVDQKRVVNKRSIRYILRRFKPL